jgi:flagellar biosynthesis protein FlhB
LRGTLFKTLILSAKRSVRGLYKAVAEVLAYVYRLRSKARGEQINRKYGNGVHEMGHD